MQFSSNVKYICTCFNDYVTYFCHCITKTYRFMKMQLWFEQKFFVLVGVLTGARKGTLGKDSVLFFWRSWIESQYTTIMWISIHISVHLLKPLVDICPLTLLTLCNCQLYYFSTYFPFLSWKKMSFPYRPCPVNKIKTEM